MPAPKRRTRRQVVSFLFGMTEKPSKLAASTPRRRRDLIRGEPGVLRMATAIRGMAGSEFELRCPLQKERASYRKSFLFGFRGESKCSAEMNSASAKVFAFGENACTPQKRRRPEGRLCGASIPFRDFKISILTGPSKIKGHLLCRCPFILGSAARRAAPPFGISMLGAAEPPLRQDFHLR